MKMRRHKHTQAALSRNQRELAEWRAEFRQWHEDLGSAFERAATAISDFIFDASEAWEKACNEAAKVMQQRMVENLTQHTLREHYQ